MGWISDLVAEFTTGEYDTVRNIINAGGEAENLSEQQAYNIIQQAGLEYEYDPEEDNTNLAGRAMVIIWERYYNGQT